MSANGLNPEFVHVTREDLGDFSDGALEVGVGLIGDVLRRSQHRGVDFLVAEGDVARRGFAHGRDDELVGVWLAGLVKFSHRYQNDARSRHMLDEFERPKTDRLLDEALLRAFVGGIDRSQRGEEVEAWIDLLGQLHFKREVVDFLQAGDFLGLALLDLSRALDHADKTRPGIRLRAVHQAM